MKNMLVFPDKILHAAEKLKSIENEWLSLACDITDDDGQGTLCREKLLECGKIISGYAELLTHIHAGYEQTENQIIYRIGENI
jgi:hypothetical protein